MLVRCPKCETGFRLPAEKIPDKGAKLKCSACTHTFRVRVGDEGEPVYFQKRGAEPAGGKTQIGGPLNANADESAENEDVDGSKTQLGAVARSKSAQQGYNPFPLAGGGDEEDEEEEEDLGEEVSDEEGGRTQMFTGAAADEGGGGAPPAIPSDGSGDRTQLGAAARAGGPANGRPVDESGEYVEDGDSTQALGSGGLHLFDEEEGSLQDESEDVSTMADFDPFGDAFDAPVDADVGLLMPSTPIGDEVSVERRDSHMDLEEPSDVGLSEDAFLLGGQQSEFGPADELVDPSFGDDVRAFDPDSGAMETQEPTKRRARRNGRQSGEKLPPEELQLEDVHTKDAERKKKKKRKAPAAESERAGAQPERAKEKKKKKPIASDYAPHRVGAGSPLRRAFDVVFIAVVVLLAFILFVSARAGWFFDFTRAGHMLEVAFAGEEFEPREEWAKVVEVEPPEPPPEQPLRLQNVRALEAQVGGKRVVVVSGTIRNYSLKAFKSVTVRAEVVDPDDKIISEQTAKAGRVIDRDKLAAAKTVDEAAAAMETKLPDVGKEGRIHFAFVFDDVPAKVLKSGDYDYRVAITESGS